MSKTSKTAVAAWLLVSVYYFHQYALRSAPSVMIPQLSEAFGLSALGVASIAGLFYYGYSPFSLVVGPALDRLGARRVLPVGAVIVGIGAILFAIGGQTGATVGRFLQGAGGAFPLIGAVYITSRYLPATKAATLIGAVQMFGMAGGFAGQFAVGPVIESGVPWQNFWIIMGAAGIGVGLILFIFLPKEKAQEKQKDFFKSTVTALKTVSGNSQTILCGLIAGLIFIPTTIFDMVWGVRFLQDGYGLDYGTAVMRSAAVPFGWIIGCPLLGYISDKIGRRKPVIIGGSVVLMLCLAWSLFGNGKVFPPFSVALIAGIASGAGMIPYSVLKDANPPHLSGTATGVCNFINFTFSALMGPIFAWFLLNVSTGTDQFLMKDYRITFEPLLFGVGVAILLTFFLKETGRKAKTQGKMHAVK